MTASGKLLAAVIMKNLAVLCHSSTLEVTLYDDEKGPLVKVNKVQWYGWMWCSMCHLSDQPGDNTTQCDFGMSKKKKKG